MGKTIVSAGLLAFGRLPTLTKKYGINHFIASRISAQVVSMCTPADNNVCYKLNIPESTASTGNGDIFFQLSAPSTYEWIALGQGNSMSNSNIFVMYTSTSGNNVTLSPRLGKGHSMPNFNGDAQVTLLEGSGVSNGKMVANVKCSNCQSWSGGTADFKADEGTWIYALKPGSAKNTDDQRANIAQHSVASGFEWEYANAKGGNSVNPFLTVSTSDVTSNSGTGTTSCKSRRILIAHATLAALAFVILFPTGAIAIRLASFPGIVWFHAAWQMFSYLVYIAAFGLGLYMAEDLNLLNSYHPIIGIVLFIALFFQPILGQLHHLGFKRYGHRTLWSHLHLWLGRSVITLGIINGGLGFKLAKFVAGGRTYSRSGMIAYSVVAAFMWIAYVAASVLGERRKKKAGVAVRKDEPPKYEESPVQRPLEERGNTPNNDIPLPPRASNTSREGYYGPRKQ
ncbi:CBD9-like protein [Delitschia confertaspora ATCC 74209]|uniref:CBD9-like protein n=1 Tax=Delitschia confertaspora ATCC 74209 TaxID=1513339 RepID=A0A9P4MWC7_9PLEO|nr:CBD9-like protein [Delitschia confertaspora ATCC 74209]